MTKLILAIALSVPLPAVTAEVTLCKPGETTHWSCPTKGEGKVISICGNRAFDPNELTGDSDDWIQYRFGSRERIEMTYPKDRKASLAKFSYQFTNLSPLYADELSFRVSSYTYTLFDLMPGDAPSKYGVRVERDNRTVSTMYCARKPTGSLHTFSNALWATE